MGAEQIVVVSGLGRCGTSLMMQMLVAGGMEAYSQDGYPFYEDDRVIGIGENPEIAKELKGKAVKLLQPLYFKPPRGYDYRFIYMTRDPMQQALSSEKFLTHELGAPLQEGYVDALYADIPKRDIESRQFLLTRAERLFVIRFETLLVPPVRTLEALVEFVGFPLDIDAMRKVPVKRSEKNYDGLLELKLSEERRKLLDGQ